MSGFENYSKEAAEIELEIERKGIALGIDWNDEVQVRSLARDALNFKLAPAAAHDDWDTNGQGTRIDLYGLAQLMLTVMHESADEQIHTHGGPIWKIFGHALWQEAEILGLVKPDRSRSGGN